MTSCFLDVSYCPPFLYCMPLSQPLNSLLHSPNSSAQYLLHWVPYLSGVACNSASVWTSCLLGLFLKFPFTVPLNWIHSITELPCLLNVLDLIFWSTSSKKCVRSKLFDLCTEMSSFYSHIRLIVWLGTILQAANNFFLECRKHCLVVFQCLWMLTRSCLLSNSLSF